MEEKRCIRVRFSVTSPVAAKLRRETKTFDSIVVTMTPVKIEKSEASIEGHDSTSNAIRGSEQ